MVRASTLALLLSLCVPAHGATPIEASCDLTGRVPKNFRVLGTGASGGREIDRQIDPSGRKATQFDVAVHAPGLPVVLALGANQPTIWRIGWTQETRIAAVVASGDRRQIVLGLPKGVPVLTITSGSGSGSGCRSFSNFVNTGRDYELDQANKAMRAIAGRGIDRVYLPRDRGFALVGEVTGSEKFVTSNDYKLDDFVAGGACKGPGCPK